MAEEMRPLIGPYEILDLADRGSVRIRIVSSERGSIVIHPRYPGAPPEKTIPALRVHLAPGVKPYPPNYYDITSKTLTAQLVPFLMQRDFMNYEFVITKYGIAPKARFTLERVSLPV